MSAENPSLHASLIAAIGEDAQLMADLKGAFLEGAQAHLATMDQAATLADRQAAAWRLHGLAASFGAVTLMDSAADVASARRDSPAAMRRVHLALAALGG